MVARAAAGGQRNSDAPFRPGGGGEKRPEQSRPARYNPPRRTPRQTSTERPWSEDHMDEAHDTPRDPKHRVHGEYEDPHYHDEEEAAPAEDVERPRSRPPARRQ